MTLLASDIQAAVQAGGYGTDTAAQQLTFLRGLLRRLYGMRRWRFLEQTNSALVTAVATPTVSLATITTLTHVDAVRLTFGTTVYDLEHRPEQLVRAYDADDQTARIPLYWAQRNATIQFWPRPDRIYTVQLDYLELPTLPAVASDPIVWPDQHADVLTWGVIERMGARQRDAAMTNLGREEYTAALKEMLQAFGIQQRQTTGRVEQWSGWADVQR
jgi:hypothetical protein